MIKTSIVTTKGQIVLPVALRRKLGIKAGTRVFLELRGSDIVVHPTTPEFYDQTFGILKGSGLVKTLQKLRQADKRREKTRFERA